MNASPTLRRWLSILGTGAILTAVLVAVALQRSSGQAEEKKGPVAGKKDGRSWPLFGGSVQRNLVNLVDKNPPKDWDTTPEAPKNIKWKEKLGSKAYGGLVISGGKIFVGTNNDQPRDPKVKGDKGVMMCFNEADGKFLWQMVYDKLPAGRVNDWPGEGICSNPVVEGKHMWYVSNRAEVVCADVETGNPVWKLDMIGKLNVFPHNLATCSPLLVGDTLFVITSNGVDEDHLNIPAPKAPSFIAVDKNKGEVLWQNNDPSINLINARNQNPNVRLKDLVDKGLALMHGQWSNPVYAEPNGKPMIIFPGGDGWMRAFDPRKGELLWKFDCNPKESTYELGGRGTRNDFVATPIVYDNKLYIGVGQDPEHKKGVGHLWCIDITKEPKNKDKDLSPATRPGKKEGDPPQTIVDAKDPANKDSGLVWHYGGPCDRKTDNRGYLFGRSLSTCAVHDGLCYTADYDGRFYCFDAKTGEKYWDTNLPHDTWSSPSWVDGHIYIGCESGDITIFKQGKKKDIVATVNMEPVSQGSQVRVTPIVSKGVLYVVPENPCFLYAIAPK